MKNHYLIGVFGVLMASLAVYQSFVDSAEDRYNVN